MSVTIPLPLPSTTWVRDYYAGGHVDRPADRRAAADELDLESRRRAVTAEASAAGADDGTRVEAVPARGAVEGHGWSVSATRTIGKAPGARVSESGPPGFDAMPGMSIFVGDGEVWHRMPDGRWSVTSWLDAVRDEPVLPDPEPEQNVGGASQEPTIRTTRDDCPTCKRPRRERGEVRTSIWRCGCAVRPERVEIDGVSWGWHQGTVPKNCGTAGEVVRVAYGIGVTGAHPTHDGAIAAWRVALAELQRREDEQ